MVLVGPAREATEEALGRLARLGNVHWLGAVSYDELPRYVAAFDVALIPYLTNAYTRSCFPLKTFEYLAAGKPVVASGLPELQGWSPTWSLVDDGDLDGFSAAIERALDETSQDAISSRQAACRSEHVGDALEPAARAHRSRALGMRILVATDQWFPDRMGGVARVATDTARGWARLGHEVVVLAPRHDGMGEETNEDGVIVKRVLARNRLPQTLTDPRATRAAAARLAGTGFDVVVGHSCTSASGLLDAGLDAPLVYVFHASAADEARDLRTRLRPGRRVGVGRAPRGTVAQTDRESDRACGVGSRALGVQPHHPR